MIGVYIHSPSMTVEQYKKLEQKIEATVGGEMEGLKLHTCFTDGESGGASVFDVWESKEAFEAFGAKLMPIAQELGIEVPAPQFVEMIAYQAV